MNKKLIYNLRINLYIQVFKMENCITNQIVSHTSPLYGDNNNSQEQVLNISKVKKAKKVIDVASRCLALKVNGAQCTRQKLNTTEYCKLHSTNRQNGTIDNIPMDKISAKRGRKKKVSIDAKYFDNNFITMWKECINEIPRFVDRYGNVYTIDDVKPTFIGKRAFDNTLITPTELIKYIKDDKTFT